MVSTASRVGTGNIVGVANAIAIGGYGAVFWMWLIAIVGGATAFVESTLAQIYKKKDPEGGSYGGPSYYIQAALKSRVLGVVFAIALIATYAGGFNMLASYNLISSFTSYDSVSYTHLDVYKRQTPGTAERSTAGLHSHCSTRSFSGIRSHRGPVGPVPDRTGRYRGCLLYTSRCV